MRERTLRLSTARLILGCALLVSPAANAAAPDVSLFNGGLFTGHPARPRAEAVAIRGERIVAVGANGPITALAGRKPESIDLQGRVVVPGFNDARYHFMPKLPATNLALSFPEPTWAEVLAAVTGAAKQAAPGTLIYGEVGGLVVTDPNATLLDAGIPLALGSDGPMNPGLNLMCAVTHLARPSEAITREQAVIAYTRGSAYAEFEETGKGALAPGQLADLAVLSQDIFTVAATNLPNTTSVLTLVGGKVVFDAGVLRRAGGRTK